MAEDDEKLPRSRVVHVSFDLALPIDATKAEIEEWIRFELRGGSLHNDNKLVNHDIEMVGEPLLTDSRMHLHTSTEPCDGGTMIRRWLAPEPFDGPDPMEEIAANAPRPR